MQRRKARAGKRPVVGASVLAYKPEFAFGNVPQKTDNRDAFASRLPLPPQQYVDFCRNFAMVPVPEMAREKIPLRC